jgi:signal transduction histidine kinase
MIAGVAGGLSARLAFDVTLVRVALVLLALGSGFGLALYILLWLFVPMQGETTSIAARAADDRRGIVLAVAFLPALGVVVAVASALGIGYISSVSWAVFVVGAGLVLVYRNAPEDEQMWLRKLVEPALHLEADRSRWRAGFVVRVLVGAALLIGGCAILVRGHSRLSALTPLGGAVLVLGAVVVLFGPWWLRIARDLAAERQARARAEERSDMALRVHDSVLQTLALIQRSAGDPKQVTRLARAQERELRTWLFEGVRPGMQGEEDPRSMAATMEHLAQRVEGDHGVVVESVTVGDCALDDDVRALVSAAGEAATNAAKWSGAASVSLYTEVQPDRVEIFVRDRGSGFEPTSVPSDRQGVAGSIVARMERHGGRAKIRSALGRGTEVELLLPRHEPRREQRREQGSDTTAPRRESGSRHG